MKNKKKQGLEWVKKLFKRKKGLRMAWLSARKSPAQVVIWEKTKLFKEN